MREPLILTLQLDAFAQEFYEGLRQQYFPPERNLIPAHLTLFHHLPNDSFTERTVAEAAGRYSSFMLSVTAARSVGRGVAVFFRCEPLMDLHAALSAAFEGDLIPQDRQRFQPHIVVQNKVDPALARETLGLVRDLGFVKPYGVGLTLWRYLGGAAGGFFLICLSSFRSLRSLLRSVAAFSESFSFVYVTKHS